MNHRYLSCAPLSDIDLELLNPINFCLLCPALLRLFAAVPKPDGYLGSVFGFLLAAARMHDCTPKYIPPVSEIALAGCSSVQTANGMPRWPW